MTRSLSLLVSVCVYLSVVIWSLFLSTINSFAPRIASLLATDLVPFAWPYAVLWMGIHGVQTELVFMAAALSIFSMASLLLVSVFRLYARLPIVEYLVCSPQGSWAIPLSEKERYIKLNRLYDYQLEHTASSLEEKARMDELIATAVVPGFDLVTGLGSLISRFGYSRNYWSDQGWFWQMVGRLMSGRQMQIIALLDMLKNQAAFPVRMRKFVFLQLFCLAFAGVVAATLSWLIPLQFLVPMIALFPVIRYLANLYGHVPLSCVRSLPYSAHDIVWALIKRGWVESICFWPIAAGALALTIYALGNPAEYIARSLLITTTLAFAAPMSIVSFSLHNKTRQSKFNLYSLYVSILFIALMVLGAVSGILMFSDSGLVAILGAALLMAVSYGISSLLIAAYLSSQVDHL